MTDKKTIDLNKLVDEIVKVRDTRKEEYNYDYIRFEHLLRQLVEQIEKLCVQTGGYTIFSVHPEYPVTEEWRKMQYGNTVYLPTIYQGKVVLDPYSYTAKWTSTNSNTGEPVSIPEHMNHESSYGDKYVFDKYYRQHLKYINKQNVEALLKAILKETKELTASRLHELDAIKQTIKNIDELGVNK